MVRSCGRHRPSDYYSRTTISDRDKLTIRLRSVKNRRLITTNFTTRGVHRADRSTVRTRKRGRTNGKKVHRSSPRATNTRKSKVETLALSVERLLFIELFLFTHRARAHTHTNANTHTHTQALKYTNGRYKAIKMTAKPPKCRLPPSLSNNNILCGTFFVDDLDSFVLLLLLFIFLVLLLLLLCYCKLVVSQYESL